MVVRYQFFTNLTDGFLARKYKINSILGSKTDSIKEVLTIVFALIVLFVYLDLFFIILSKIFFFSMNIMVYDGYQSET